MSPSQLINSVSCTPELSDFTNGRPMTVLVKRMGRRIFFFYHYQKEYPWGWGQVPRVEEDWGGNTAVVRDKKECSS